MLGSIVWFNQRSGYGFLRCEGYEKDLFFHFTRVEDGDRKFLEPGLAVEIDSVVEDSKARLVATGVRLIWDLVPR